METIQLSNGVEMPILGYGVFLIPPQQAEQCVTDALSIGYRLRFRTLYRHQTYGQPTAMQRHGTTNGNNTSTRPNEHKDGIIKSPILAQIGKKYNKSACNLYPTSVTLEQYDIESPDLASDMSLLKLHFDLESTPIKKE